jgi:hypothetical protein
VSTFKLLLAEIFYRKVNFALSLFAVMIAVTLFVAGPLLVDGYGQQTQSMVAQMEKETGEELALLEKETRKLMRDMGFNLMIVHEKTNMSDFWAADFAAEEMPQEYVDRLAGDPRLTLVTHLVATLQEKITWENRKVLLVGYLPEATQSHMRKKAPMGYNIAPGKAYLGYELGVGRNPGDKIEVLGKELEIDRILPEQGSKEDITIAVHLEDAQAVLGKPNSVNQIMALGCHCAGSNLPNIRKQLAEILPETRITEFRSMALARAEQRDLVEKQQAEILANVKKSREGVQQTLTTLAAVVTPVVVLAAAVWVGLLAMANVRERRTEIGLLRALGKGTMTIGTLFLGKAFLLGLLGAGAGFVLGTWVAGWLGSQALDVATTHFSVRYDVLLSALVGAPLLSVVASYLPTLTALMQDPAVVLRDV